MLQSKEHIGRLDERITFQQEVMENTASNEDAQTGWQDIDDTPVMWAEVEEKSGSEFFRAEQLTDKKVGIFRIRYRADLTTKMSILRANGERYNITAILEQSRNRYLKITAETGPVMYNEAES